jgi:hypothetical protein
MKRCKFCNKKLELSESDIRKGNVEPTREYCNHSCVAKQLRKEGKGWSQWGGTLNLRTKRGAYEESI